MIELTRLNGNPMLVNSDLIKTVEPAPDTLLTLIHGEKMLVRESIEEVREKILEYRAGLLAAMMRSLPSPVELQRASARSSLSRFTLEGETAPGGDSPHKTSPAVH